MSVIIYHDCNSDDAGDWRLNTPSDLAACFVDVVLDTSNKQCGGGSLKFDAVDRVTWRNTDGDSFFPGVDSTIGALRFWYRQTGAAYGHPQFPLVGLYNSTACDTPTSRNELSLSWSNSAFNSLVILIRDKDGVEKVGQSQAWTPDADTWYHVELNWDGVAGETRLFVNGSKIWENLTTTFDRGGSSYPCNRLMHRPMQSGSEQAWIDEVNIYDEVQHTSNFTPANCPGEGVVFCVPWNVNTDACIPEDLTPNWADIGNIDNSIYKYGGGAVTAELDSGNYLVYMVWTGLTVLPGNAGAIGYWTKSDYAPADGKGSVDFVQLYKSGPGGANKLIISNDIKRDGMTYDYDVSLRMYDSAGVQALIILGTLADISFTDWHYIEVNWLWNYAGGITEISVDGTVVASSTNGSTKSRSGGSDTPRLWLSTYEEDQVEQNVWMDDFIIFDQQWHVGNFTPPAVAQCCAGGPTIGGLIIPGTFCFPNPMQRGMAG